MAEMDKKESGRNIEGWDKKFVISIYYNYSVFFMIFTGINLRDLLFSLCCLLTRPAKILKISLV